MIRKLIRNLVAWAFRDDEDWPYDEPINITQDDIGIENIYAGLFCRARPPSHPNRFPEHIHQFPYTKADAARYEAFGWQVNPPQAGCLLPNWNFEVVDGDPNPYGMTVVDLVRQDDKPSTNEPLP